MSLWIDFLGAEIRYIDTPTFGRTRIAEAGRGNQEALVLMHGIGGHLEAYAKNVVPLSAHYHVIAFDFVGHGLSEKKVDFDYSVAAYAKQIGEVMDALGLKSAHISGESLGGMAAGTFAVAHPERVKRLILNTTGGIPIVSEKGHRDLEELAELTARNTGKPPTMETVRARMQWLIHESKWDLLTDELVGTRLSFYSRPEFQKSAPFVFSALSKAGATGIPRSEMLELEKLQCETLLLWTRFNPIHDVEAAQAALPRIPKGKLYVIKVDAAHWPQYESPDEFNEVVERFLSSGEV